MSIQIAERWFERRSLDDGISLLWEPHVSHWLRCNIWHVRGRDRHLFVDTGFGYASLKEATRDLVDQPVTAIATHSHFDHVGGHHEFDDCRIHPAELHALADPDNDLLGFRGRIDEPLRAMLKANGYDLPAGLEIIDALPSKHFEPEQFRIRPCATLSPIDEGDVLDLGDRCFEVLHLPGHSPGSISLWEAATGILFSGDVIYDGQLLDQIPGADVALYEASLKRLMDLPICVVHGGHEPSFGRDRLVSLVRAQLEKWQRDG